MDIYDLTKKCRNSQISGQAHPVLESLEAYWQALRGSQTIPARTDIATSKIDHVLPYAFILQRVAPGTARFRVAGQRLHDLLKMDARGMPLGTFFLPQARAQMQDLVEAAFTGPAIISIPLVSPGTLRQPAINGTILFLPLRDTRDQNTRMLGALVTQEDPGPRPRRFMIPEDAKIRHDPIGSGRSAKPIIVPHTAKRPDASRPALRLVVNNG